MLKVNVGYSKKVGEPRYGSRGAAVSVELEVDAATIEDAELLKQRVRRLFVQVKAAVQEELVLAAEPRGVEQLAHSRVVGRSANRPATPAQLKALHRIADRWQFDLSQWLFERYGSGDPAELSLGQASEELRGGATGRNRG